MSNNLYSESILLIEDEDFIRLSLRTRLTREGYRVDEAPDGESGLEAINRKQPDLILLDYRLPGRDGMSVLREVAEEHPDIVVILRVLHGAQRWPPHG